MKTRRKHRIDEVKIISDFIGNCTFQGQNLIRPIDKKYKSKQRKIIYSICEAINIVCSLEFCFKSF